MPAMEDLNRLPPERLNAFLQRYVGRSAEEEGFPGGPVIRSSVVEIGANDKGFFVKLRVTEDAPGHNAGGTYRYATNGLDSVHFACESGGGLRVSSPVGELAISRRV